jgi:hypothetical protein
MGSLYYFSNIMLFGCLLCRKNVNNLSIYVFDKIHKVFYKGFLQKVLYTKVIKEPWNTQKTLSDSQSKK